MNTATQITTINLPAKLSEPVVETRRLKAVGLAALGAVLFSAVVSGLLPAGRIAFELNEFVVALMLFNVGLIGLMAFLMGRIARKAGRFHRIVSVLNGALLCACAFVAAAPAAYFWII